MFSCLPRSSLSIVIANPLFWCGLRLQSFVCVRRLETIYFFYAFLSNNIILGYFSVKFILIIICIFFMHPIVQTYFVVNFLTINILISGMNVKSGFIIRFFFVRNYFKRIIIISMLFSQKKLSIMHSGFIHFGIQHNRHNELWNTRFVEFVFCFFLSKSP